MWVTSIFRNLPCIHTRYILSCLFRFTMRRLSIPRCSVTNIGCRGQLTRGDKRLGWTSAWDSELWDERILVSSMWWGCPRATCEDGCDEDGSTGRLSTVSELLCDLDLDFGLRSSPPSATSGASDACRVAAFVPVKSNDSSSAKFIIYINDMLVIILPRVKKYTLVLSPLI